MCFLNKREHLLVSELYIYQNARCNDKNLIASVNANEAYGESRITLH